MSRRKLYTATNDVIFKMLFTRHTDLLKAFIAEALSIDIKEITKIVVKNTEIPPNYIEGKLTRLDIVIGFNNKLVNIEMQVSKRNDYKERALYYWARMYSDAMQQGRSYNETRDCICINILNFPMFDCKNYHSSFSVREDNSGEILTDKMHIHFFELTKVKRIKNKSSDNEDIDIDDDNSEEIIDNNEDETNLKLWMQLFKARNKEELTMLLEKNVPEINRSIEVILELNKDDEVCKLARSREEAEMDYYSGIKSAEKKGIEKGIKKGIKKGMSEGIKKGIAEGIKKGEIDVKNKLISMWKEKGLSDEEINELLDGI